MSLEDFNRVKATWGDVIEQIFKDEPSDPFSYRIEIIEENVDEYMVSRMLADFCILGARKKFNKELCDLTPEEAKEIHKYLWSIGWDAEYTDSYSIEMKDGVEVPVIRIHTEFKRCPLSYARNM